MILGLEIGMLVYGLYVLYSGKFQLSKQRIVEGGRARLAGLICVLPLPLAFAAGFILGSTGQLTDRGSAAILEIIIVVSCLIAALVVAYTDPRKSNT
jgi:hypothetical protein